MCTKSYNGNLFSHGKSGRASQAAELQTHAESCSYVVNFRLPHVTKTLPLIFMNVCGTFYHHTDKMSMPRYVWNVLLFLVCNFSFICFLFVHVQ